jgi:hypothetical protein
MGLHLGAALVFIQKLDVGRGAVRTGLTLNPPFAIRRMRRMSDDATFRAQASVFETVCAWPATGRVMSGAGHSHRFGRPWAKSDLPQGAEAAPRVFNHLHDTQGEDAQRAIPMGSESAMEREAARRRYCGVKSPSTSAPKRRADLDNFNKVSLDALTGIAYL